MACLQRIWIVVMAGAALAAAAETGVVNGDFERPWISVDDLAATWSLMGTSALPQQLQIDTRQPHGGRQCVRLTRPAGPDVWSVALATAPENSVRNPQAGMAYTLSFWARTDRPGTSVVRVQSYRKIMTKEAGPTIGIYDIALDQQWRRHAVTWVGDWDVRVRDAECVYPVFLPVTSGDTEQEKTIWLDDVQMTAEPADPARRVGIDPGTIAVPEVPLRLSPGPSIAVRVDAARVLHPVQRAVSGLSISGLSRWGGPLTRTGDYGWAPEADEAIRALRLPLTRCYGLTDDDLADGSWEVALDTSVGLMRRYGIPTAASIIEPEPVHANASLDLDAWRRIVTHAQEQRLGIRYWEVGNEVWMSVYGRAYGGRAFPTADDYIRHVREVSRLVKSLQPDAQIGISVLAGHIQWCDHVVAGAAGAYDFICPHLYNFTNLRTTRFEEAVVAQNHDRLQDAQRITAMARAVNPGREVMIYDSEWGLHDDTTTAAWKEERNGNQVGMLHRAVRMLYYARERIVGGASGWTLWSEARHPGFLVMASDQPSSRSMLYCLYRAMNQHLGDQVVAIEGAVPYDTFRQGSYPVTPLMATLRNDGAQLEVMVVNATQDRDIPAVIDLQGFSAQRVTGLLLHHADLQAGALVAQESDMMHPLDVESKPDRVAFTLPRHSVAFITCDRKIVPTH